MMARVVAQSALLTTTIHAHRQAPFKEIGRQKGSVKMVSGLETPLLRISRDSICLGNKLVRFGQDSRSPITFSSRPGSDSGCVAKDTRFEGFTGKALEAIMIARDESRWLGHNSIEPVHILLGLIGEGTGIGIAAEVLKSTGIKLKDVREYAIKNTISISFKWISSLWFNFSSFTTDILILSFEESRKLGHNYIGTEHLLLGLLRHGSARDGAPGDLENLGFDLSNIRKKVLRMVGESDKVSVVTKGSTSNTKVTTHEGYRSNLMHCTGATTPDEYIEHIEKDLALATPFLPIKVTESSVEGTMVALRGLKDHYEIHHKLCYERDAVITAAELSNQYISDGFLPDKAIDLFDKAGAHVSTRHAELLGVVKELRREFRQFMKSKKEEGHILDKKKFSELHNREMELKMQIHILHKMSQADKIVKEVDFQGIVSSRSGIPFEKLVINESDRLRKMEETLHKRVIGQDEAVKAVCFCAYDGLWRFISDKPIASFIFYGPTGVGKSELAKALAANYFGSEEAVIQLDMTEFMESHTLSKLIGSSTGPEGGQLTDAVWKQPHTVVLLKEMEKAHIDVLNVIHQIISVGILTDGLGRTVDFKNTLLIMTSNAGSSVIEKGKRLMKFDLNEECRYDSIKSLVVEELKQWLGPVLVTMLAQVIVFRHLNKLEVKEIADIKLKEVFDRLKAKEIQLHFTERFRERVVEQGYDTTHGARPLKRAIRHLEDSMTEKMVAREIKEGDSVTVDVNSGGNIMILNDRCIGL